MSFFEQFKDKCRHLTKTQKLLILYLPIHLIWYMILEQVNAGDDYILMHCALDDAIPFCEWFVFPYLSWFLYMAIPGFYLMVKDDEGFELYLRILWTGFFMACLFLCFFSTGQELRPDTLERHNVATWIVNFIYGFDTNTNVFPSMHVIGAMSVLVGIAKSKELRKFRWVQICSPILCVLIILATMFLKQHSALDVLGGFAFFAVACGIVALYYKIRAVRRQKAV